MPAQAIFDGHNDVLLRLWRRERPAGGPSASEAFLQGETHGHLDLPKCVKGGFAGGMFAIFVPSKEPAASNDKVDAAMATGHYQVPISSGVGLADAAQATLAMAGLLFQIEKESAGRVRICRSVADIRAAKAAGALAPVLHIEGCEAIDPDMRALEALYAAGLRSLGPVWSRSNIFGHGVPFRFPSTPDIGDGLTDAGKALIKACNEMHILIDLSHLNEKGFWDVAKLSNAPLVATHSNVHAICASSRNLNAKQLAAVRASGGMVGLNFATSFLRPDGKRLADTALDVLVDHLAALIDHLGEDGVGLGSDFDGAQMPNEIHDAAGLPNLVAAMTRRGFGAALIEKICFENWMRVLQRTWGN
jgi:membrane dipeptidase